MSPGTSTTMLRLALAGLLASAPCALWAGEVTGISVNQGSTGTRVEIQLAGAGQYKTLSLKGPDRLVVDLPASKAKAGLRLPAPTGIVRALDGADEGWSLRMVAAIALGGPATWRAAHALSCDFRRARRSLATAAALAA